MCFGNNSTTSTTNKSGTQTSTPPAWLGSAAQSNINYAQALGSSGFTPYSANQVAAFSPQQTQSFGMGSDIANAAASNIPTGAQALSNYTTAGPQHVQGDTIANNMSPYLNQYVSYALAPQLAASRSNQALQSQLMQGQATSAGAFGDPRANNLQATQGMLAALQEQGLVGNAYNAAFNTAIGAGAQDVSFGLNAQTTNANLAEQALQRQLTGSNAIFSQGTGATNLTNTLGAQQTAQTQAGLNAAYNQWLMAQQYPFQVSQLQDQALAAARGAGPTTTTSTGTDQTSTPNNAGYGILGAGIGAVGTALGGPIGGMAASGLWSALGPGGTPNTGATQAGATGPNGSYYGPGYGPGTTAPMYYAAGGKTKKKQPVIVGERGPELFVPREKGVVIPNHEVRKLADKYAKRKPGQTHFAAGGMILPTPTAAPHPALAGVMPPNAAPQIAPPGPPSLPPQAVGPAGTPPGPAALPPQASGPMQAPTMPPPAAAPAQMPPNPSMPAQRPAGLPMPPAWGAGGRFNGMPQPQPGQMPPWMRPNMPSLGNQLGVAA